MAQGRCPHKLQSKNKAMENENTDYHPHHRGSDFAPVLSHDWAEYEKISHKHYHQVPQDSDLTICTFTLPYRWHQLMHTSSRSPLRLASRTLQRLFLSKKSNSSPPTPQMDEAWGRFTKTGSSMPTPFHLSLLIF